MSKPITINRRELYDLVWAKPMRDVAAELGISDVGLAKVCDRHRVPKPERGYWNKRQAGQKVKQAVFVEVDDRQLNQVEIRGGLSQVPPAAREILEKAKAERKAKSPIQNVAPQPIIEPVIDVHSAIRRTAQVLRKAKPDTNGAIQAMGEGLCGVDVATGRVERAIAFLDALARELDAKSLPLRPTGQSMEVSRDGDKAVFALKERTKREKHTPTEAELAAEAKRQQKLERMWRSPGSWDNSLHGRSYPEFDTVYTGEFILSVEGYSDGVRRTWGDGKVQTVEGLVESIAVGLDALLAARRAEREKREEWQRQYAEMERRRDLSRKRKEREEKRLTYLRSILDVADEIDRLRTWLSSDQLKLIEGTDANLPRLVIWAKARLSKLETRMAAASIEQDLNTKGLFPAADELHDPLGDPPKQPYW